MYVPSIPWWDPAVTGAEADFALCDTTQLVQEEGQQAYHGEAADSVPTGTHEHTASPHDQVSRNYTCAIAEHMLLCPDAPCIRNKSESTVSYMCTQDSLCCVEFLSLVQALCHRSVGPTTEDMLSHDCRDLNPCHQVTSNCINIHCCTAMCSAGFIKLSLVMYADSGNHDSCGQ